MIRSIDLDAGKIARHPKPSPGTSQVQEERTLGDALFLPFDTGADAIIAGWIPLPACRY